MAIHFHHTDLDLAITGLCEVSRHVQLGVENLWRSSDEECAMRPRANSCSVYLGCEDHRVRISYRLQDIIYCTSTRVQLCTVRHRYCDQHYRVCIVL